MTFCYYDKKYHIGIHNLKQNNVERLQARIYRQTVINGKCPGILDILIVML